jgi:hypothetical protein
VAWAGIERPTRGFPALSRRSHQFLSIQTQPLGSIGSRSEAERRTVLAALVPGGRGKLARPLATGTRISSSIPVRTRRVRMVPMTSNSALPTTRRLGRLGRPTPSPVSCGTAIFRSVNGA